ncbi:MAG: DNA topoisomerase IB [Gemmatimonadetes bacterium]|nr:DNA topoisomerase IB [Gemmatimonadota bacterium]
MRARSTPPFTPKARATFDESADEPADTPLDIRIDRNEEAARAAVAAGLTYVTDSDPGISRSRSGTGFTYHTADGRLIADRQERRRIGSLAIPPAWTDVWICPDPSGHIQATARDAKGRKQYRYHARFRTMRDQSKFGRMLVFSEALPELRDQIERDLAQPGLPRRKLLATLVRLLDKTLIRVGNDEYIKANKSYGLTTLRRRHVEVTGHTVRFEFRGKSGIQHSIAITDRQLAGIVRQLQDLPGQQLFKYVDGNGKRQSIDSDDVNAYLREVTGLDVTAKDFRTWSGTMIAARALRELGPAASERTARMNVNRALDQVAARLRNTRAVCRKYYVHPAIIEAYHRGVAVPPPPAPKAPGRTSRVSAALRREEVGVLQFLQSELAS